MSIAVSATWCKLAHFSVTLGGILQKMQSEKTQNTREYYVIDFKHIVKAIWHKAWLVCIVALLTAVVGFCYAKFGITPKYSSEVMLYVNNSSISLGEASISISASEISAAQSLVKTYMVILNNRTTLNEVIKHAGADCTYEQLSGMLACESVNNTEIMRVRVTSDDPYEAEKLVNSIAVVLPLRISEIIKGSSMEVVDAGVVNHNKVSPSLAKYAAIGFVIGLLAIVLIIGIRAHLDDSIHDENYLIETLDYPLLAIVPDLLDDRESSYGYRNANARK